MSILLVLIPISLLLLGIAIVAFVWAVKRGQYDDLDTPALDILIDDERPAPARDASQSVRAADAPGHDVLRADAAEIDSGNQDHNHGDTDDAGPLARSRD